jgi:hypothetical protein
MVWLRLIGINFVDHKHLKYQHNMEPGTPIRSAWARRLWRTIFGQIYADRAGIVPGMLRVVPGVLRVVHGVLRVVPEMVQVFGSKGKPPLLPIWKFLLPV